ncbi:MAG TPA: stage III sporulation protein SpoIIIAB [Candidatus Angelobacter sp.]|nr:stage III sporulation protein SpoIIIAB [Candidatus Angelobacter sp.]
MKLIGAILVLIASSLIGFTFSARFRERPKQLSQLRSALQSLEAEITYGLTPVYEAALHLAGQMPEPVNRFFGTLAERIETGKGQPLSQIWQETLEAFWPKTALKKNEKEVWRQFGLTLGQSDRANQQKYIQLALSHLEREEKEARSAQQQYEKMVKSLGFLGGILIILLLF